MRREPSNQEDTFNSKYRFAQTIVVPRRYLRLRLLMWRTEIYCRLALCMTHENSSSLKVEREWATRLFFGPTTKQCTRESLNSSIKRPFAHRNLNQRRMCCEVCLCVNVCARKARVIKTGGSCTFALATMFPFPFDLSSRLFPLTCKQHDYLSYIPLVMASMAESIHQFYSHPLIRSRRLMMRRASVSTWNTFNAL